MIIKNNRDNQDNNNNYKNNNDYDNDSNNNDMMTVIAITATATILISSDLFLYQKKKDFEKKGKFLKIRRHSFCLATSNKIRLVACTL